MSILISWLISALVILAAAYILPGVDVDSFTTALVVALVLGVINAFIKPILILLTLPITLVTLGLFAFVINAGLIMLTTLIVPGFTVDGFLSALIFSVVLAVINFFLTNLSKA